MSAALKLAQRLKTCVLPLVDFPFPHHGASHCKSLGNFLYFPLLPTNSQEFPAIRLPPLPRARRISWRCPMQRTFIALCLIALTACGATEPPPPVPVPVLVVHPQPVEAANAHSYPGVIRAREEAALSFRVGGKLLLREVDAGQRVRRGQRLAQLDAADFALQVQAARAQHAAAEADLKRAQDEFERYSVLADRQLISRSLLDAQATALKAAQSQLEATRAALDVAQNQARYTELSAPADGVIASRLAEAGQVVAAGQPIYVLASDGAREVAIALPETDIARFSVGQQVEVELWSQLGTRWQGQIRELAAAADPQTRTWAARVSLPPEALDSVELGQSARVLAARGETATLQVPLSAIQPGASANVASVWVVNPATHSIESRAITPGVYGSQTVPVLSGLDPSDWIVAAGGHLLHQGQPVIAVDRHNRQVLEP